MYHAPARDGAMTEHHQGPAPDDSSAYVPRTEPAYGPQLVAIYFGARHCGYCVRRAFKAALRRLGRLLEPQAASAGRTLHFAAVAIEWDAEEGFAYVHELGKFDEVSSGGN